MSRKPLNAEADLSAHDAKAIWAHFDAESTESSLDAKADCRKARSTPRSSAGHQRQNTFAYSTNFKNREDELDAEKARFDAMAHCGALDAENLEEKLAAEC